MQPIKLLPQRIVNQIAAGEVIERPSSVVKELIENAIDAGSTEITVRIVDGGKNFISVADNGSGMDRDSLEMCIMSHATSKLTSENLFDIHTFGFRGEALPSIASVSRLSITTSDNDNNEAWQLQMEGQNNLGTNPSSRAKGTTIEVRDLFFATPARLKFLKSESYEAERCKEIFNDLALANCGVSFKFIDTEKEKAFYIKTNDLKKRVDDIFGESFSKNIFDIEGKSGDLSIHGYISVPTFNKSASNCQYFFVNGRLVKEKIFTAALKSAYAGLIPNGRYAAAILYIDMPYGDVDVNVHPAKTEIRFRDAAKVRSFVVSELRKAIETYGSNRATTDMMDRFYASISNPLSAIPTGIVYGSREDSGRSENGSRSRSSRSSFATTTAVTATNNTAMSTVPNNAAATMEATARVIPEAAYEPEIVERPWVQTHTQANTGRKTETQTADVLAFPKNPKYDTNYNKYDTKYDMFSSNGDKSSKFADSKLNEKTKIRQLTPLNVENMPEIAGKDAQISLGNAIFQVNNTYIIAESSDSIVIVDQHAAAERIMLEELKNKLKLQSQSLLIPEEISLNNAQIELLKSYNELLIKLGVYIEYKDGNNKDGNNTDNISSLSTIAVTAIPALLETSDAKAMMDDIIDELSTFGDTYTLDDKIHTILSTISCHSSLRAGKKLSVDEMNYLLRKMERTTNIAQCCHGRPSYITLTFKDLNNFFERS